MNRLTNSGAAGVESHLLRAFDDPITLHNGRVLRTLIDAGDYATALPKAVQERVASGRPRPRC